MRRTIVLMADDLGLSFESMAFVRRSMLKFVNQQMQPGDLVAVCRTGAGAGTLQQFTSDKRLLDFRHQPSAMESEWAFLVDHLR